MNTQTLLDHAALYGGDLALWPSGLRQQAEELLLRDAAARAALASEKQLDQRLHKFPAFVPAGLTEDIIAAAGRIPQSHAHSHRLHGQNWRAVASFVIFLGGLAAGYYFQQPSPSEEVDLAWLLFEDGGIQ